MQNDDLNFLLEQRSFIEEFEKSSRSRKIPVINKGTGAILELAVLLLKPLNILEIGCGNGFSTIFLLKNLGKGSKYTGIDLNSKRLEDADKSLNKLFRGKKLTFIHGNALKIVPSLDEEFDLVFIDAAKFEYPSYLKAIEKKIIKGTVIIADDILFGNKIFQENHEKHYANSIKGIKEYLELTGLNSSFDTNIIDIDDGLAISVYRGAK